MFNCYVPIILLFSMLICLKHAFANDRLLPIHSNLSDKAFIYQEGKIETIVIHPLHLSEVLLLPGDSVESIQGGDASSLSVSVSRHRTDRIFLKPRLSRGDTNLLIEGREHEYWLHVVVSPEIKQTNAYRFRWVLLKTNKKKIKMSLKGNKEVQHSPIKSLYALGDLEIIPQWFYTDKMATYFHWPLGVALPAVYASPKPHGPFHLINFRMTKGTMRVLEKSSYWRFVLGGDACLQLSTNLAYIKEESSFWHEDHCFQDLKS